MDNNEINSVNDAQLEEVSGGAGRYLYHTIVEGDTLATIANQYHTDINRLLELNPFINNANLIRIGWKVKVPR